MQATLIIPTLNRPDDLARCLLSVRKLQRGFDEIIIVDQGDLQATEQIAKAYAHLNVRIELLAVRALTRARNLGIEKAKGDLIFFVDDDTTLDEHYVETAVDYFAQHPEVVGLTGRVENMRERRGILRQVFDRMVVVLLLLASFRWEILRSGANSSLAWDLGLGTSRIRNVPFLPGCHFACRRSVFEAGFRFDERLIRWAFGEDIMFSYRVYKQYGPGSLAYLPTFKLCHYSSPDQSLTDVAAIRMQVLYRFLFWHGEVYNGSVLNALCYLYSQIGFSLLLFRQCRHTPLLALRAIVKSYGYLLAHHREIAQERIDYNRFIIDG